MGPGLQLQYWSPWIFGKLASYIGVPLIADQPTTGLERLGFARVMVEVPINKELPKLVPIKSPSGNTMVPVFYEWTPTQCENCKGWGHHADQCKGRKNEQGEWVNRAPKRRQAKGETTKATSVNPPKVATVAAKPPKPAPKATTVAAPKVAAATQHPPSPLVLEEPKTTPLVGETTEVPRDVEVLQAAPVTNSGTTAGQVSEAIPLVTAVHTFAVEPGERLDHNSDTPVSNG